MKRFFLLALVCCTSPAGAQDLVVLKSGEKVSCRIDDYTDSLLNVTLAGAAGTAGTARRTLNAGLVEFVEFGFRPGEEEAYANRGQESATDLQKWWDYWFPHLHRPRSRAAAWGVAFANALLREDPSHGAERALSLFDHVIAKAWSPEEATAARQGRLRALMAKGDLTTATTEARRLAEETEDPGLLIEVEHLLAMADFEALRKLEEEHPRWDEDDEVRPQRNELYQRALDRFLYPHLFHATREEVAARGLDAAAELLLHGGEREEARARWEDLLKLYPATTYADHASKRLAELSQPPTPPKADAP